jgi:hypothetical protein
VVWTEGELGDSLVVVFGVFEADWVDLGLALIRVLSWGWWGLVAGPGSYICWVNFVFVDDTDCVGFELDYWLWGVAATNYSLFWFIAISWRVVFGVVGSGLEEFGKRRFGGLFIQQIRLTRIKIRTVNRRLGLYITRSILYIQLIDRRLTMSPNLIELNTRERWEIGTVMNITVTFIVLVQ